MRWLCLLLLVLAGCDASQDEPVTAQKEKDLAPWVILINAPIELLENGLLPDMDTKMPVPPRAIYDPSVGTCELIYRGDSRIATAADTNSANSNMDVLWFEVPKTCHRYFRDNKFAARTAFYHWLASRLRRSP